MMRGNGSVDNAQHLAHRLGMGGEQVTQCERKAGLFSEFIIQLYAKPNGGIPTVWNQINIVLTGSITNGLHPCQASYPCTVRL